MTNTETANTLIHDNNQLREQLTAENKIYYEKVLLYIRTAGLFYNDLEIETVLMQILQDILLAQNEGETAEEFFSKTPKDVANDIISNLGKADPKESFKLFGLIFGISTFFSFISQISTENNTVNFLSIIVNGVISFLLVWAIFQFIHKSIYSKSPLSNKVVQFASLWILFSIMIVLYVFVPMSYPTVLTVTLPNSVMIGLNILFVIIALSFGFLSKKGKSFIHAGVPFVVVMNIMGILSRVSTTQEFMLSSSGKILSAILSLLCFIWFSYFFMKESKSEENLTR